jgi:hypothetical protein
VGRRGSPIVFDEFTKALNLIGVSVVDALKVRERAMKNFKKETYKCTCGKFMDGKLSVHIDFDFTVDKIKESDL